MAIARARYLDPVSGDDLAAPFDQGPETDPGTGGPSLPDPYQPPEPAPVTPPAPFVTTPPQPAPPRNQAPPTTAPSGNSLDPATVVAGWMANNNPRGHQDAAYWVRRINETGGLRQDNLDYWLGRFLEAPGTHQEGPTGGGGTAGSAASQDPSIAEFFRAQSAALAAQQARDAEIRQIIMQRLALAGQPVDENSAEVTQPLSAARNEATRSQDTERTALAERLYAQGGLNTDALTRQIQTSSERNALGLGNLRAGLITHIADAKRSELQALLQMATAQGDAAMARTISAQIAALNASVTSQGQGIQLAEFLALLNQNAANAGLNG